MISIHTLFDTNLQCRKMQMIFDVSQINILNIILANFSFFLQIVQLTDKHLNMDSFV